MTSRPSASPSRWNDSGVPHARLVQYAVIFDRIFRFAITGTGSRNYDGLGGQLLFAWLHQHHVLHWTDNRLSIEWDKVTDAVLELGEQIESLYWRSIDRPKISHWLAAYQLVAGTLEPHPASVWAKGAEALPVSGPPKGLTDAVLPDEFPLSMFYEALSRKLSPVVTSTAGESGPSERAERRPPAGLSLVTGAAGLGRRRDDQGAARRRRDRDRRRTLAGTARRAGRRAFPGSPPRWPT